MVTELLKRTASASRIPVLAVGYSVRERCPGPFRCGRHRLPGALLSGSERHRAAEVPVVHQGQLRRWLS